MKDLLHLFLPRVRSNVLLQLTIRSASEVVLVTPGRLFYCVVPHHVNFQLISLNEGRLARCASVKLFPRVGPIVLLNLRSFA